MSEWAELGRLYLYVGIFFQSLFFLVFLVILFFVLRFWVKLAKKIDEDNKNVRNV